MALRRPRTSPLCERTHSMKPYRRLKPDNGGATLYAPAPIPRRGAESCYIALLKQNGIEYVFSSEPISEGSSVFSQEAAVGSSDPPLDALRWRRRRSLNPHTHRLEDVSRVSNGNGAKKNQD